MPIRPWPLNFKIMLPGQQVDISFGQLKMDDLILNIAMGLEQ